jgi:hypothetical protein
VALFKLKTPADRVLPVFMHFLLVTRVHIHNVRFWHKVLALRLSSVAAGLSGSTEGTTVLTMPHNSDRHIAAARAFKRALVLIWTAGLNS